jgi:hypothetical protein
MNEIHQLSDSLLNLEKTPVEVATESAIRNCHLGQYRRARLDALRAISLDPEHVQAYVSLFVALFHLRSLKTSVQVITPFKTHPLAQWQFESATMAYEESQTGEYKLDDAIINQVEKPYSRRFCRR